MGNLTPNIYKLLACPDCQNDIKTKDYREMQCEGCERKFEVTEDRIISMMPSKTLPPPEIYSDPEYVSTMKRFHEIMDYSYESKSIVGYINNAYHKIQQSLIAKYSLRKGKG